MSESKDLRTALKKALASRDSYKERLALLQRERDEEYSLHKGLERQHKEKVR